MTLGCEFCFRTVPRLQSLCLYDARCPRHSSRRKREEGTGAEAHLVDFCGKVAVSQDTLDLWKMLVPLLQSLFVCMLVLFSGKELPHLLVCLCLHPPVHITS
jgi:hypothetical protein